MTPEHPSTESDRPAGRPPNVVVILLDDLGFADTAPFGSTIATPTFDELADGGLRYTNFHMTPLCSPSRACVLTGRNHHAVGLGMLEDFPSEAPGYTGRIPDSAATVARHLRDAGYGTFAVGKWHLAPIYEWGAGGPFDRWPLAMGFDQYYGFLSGATDQWFPHLVRGNTQTEPPARPEDGYHLTEDLADQAISMIRGQQAADPDKPFFLYFAPGAMHSPHHVGPEWIERYRGAFDHGWEVERDRRYRRQLELGVIPAGTAETGRPESVPEWDELSDDARRVFARQMELYAGFLTHTDAQLGRIIEHLKASGAWENTLVLITSDNGAAPGSVNGNLDFSDNDIAEMAARIDEFGAPGTFPHYARGWTWTGTTPFRYWKFFTWLGGVRTPLIVHWPAGVPREDEGGIRRQFLHAIDLAPTILDAVGHSPAPLVDDVEQQRFDGASALATFADAGAPDPRDTQYFEMCGSRAIYHDGWKATTDHVPSREAWWTKAEWAEFDPTSEPTEADLSGDAWALFDLRADPSESQDLAAAEPERLRWMIELWDVEARRNQVYPVFDTWHRPTSPHAPARRRTDEPMITRDEGGHEAASLPAEEAHR